MSLKEELSNLITNVNNIKVSIENKGESIPPQDTLNSYGDKILNIPNSLLGHIELCPEVIQGTIKNIVDTKSTILRTRCFCNCEYLEMARFENLTKINNFAFEKCFRLKRLYLTNPIKVQLVNKCAFRYTPFEKMLGNIYVPPEVYDEYVTDKHWSYFKSIIKTINSELINTTISIVGPNEWYEDDTYYFV